MIKVLSLLFIALLGSGCSDRRIAAMLIKIPIDRGITMVAYTNSHGGFHGDGETWCEFRLSETQLRSVIGIISNRKGWHRLPASGDALTAMNQMHREATNNFHEGFYFFRDKQQEWDFQWVVHINPQTADDTKKPIDERSSSNYVIAVLDTVTRRLYIYNLDT